MAIGILGEYIGRIYEEVQGRPHFIISESYNVKDVDRRGRIFYYNYMLFI